MKLAILACLLFVNFIYYVECGYEPDLLTTLDVDKPGFATFVPNNKNNKYHLAISSFHGAPFSSDYVYFIGNYTLTGSNTLQKLDNTKLLWPNEISYSPISLISGSVDPYGGLFVPGGFLVPSKTNGALYYYQFTSRDRSHISTQKPILLTKQTSQNWFYHRALIVDLNGDGSNDILTCRSYKPIFGKLILSLLFTLKFLN
jgi:hypothetical protein